MINQIVSDVAPIVVAAALAVITAIVKGVADVATEYIKTKKDQVVSKVGADNYNTYRDIAFDVYYRVEQEFKGKENVAQDKLKAFNKYLLQKIPGLTEEQLNHFRESVVGTVNNAIEETGILDRVPTNASLSGDSDANNNAATEGQNSGDTSQNTPAASTEVAAATAAISSEEVINALNTLGDIGKKVSEYITSLKK